MIPIIQASPWRNTLTDSQHLALFITFDITIVAFIGMIIWTLINRPRIALHYRRPVTLSLMIALIACLTYALILFKYLIGYTPTYLAGVLNYVPQMTLLTQVPIRYLEWATTVPLLVIELIAVSTLAGPKMHNLRNIGVASSFFMVFLGYIGGWAIDNGKNPAALIGYGAVACVLFLVVYAIVIYAVAKTIPELSSAAGRTLKVATAVMLIVWFVYPITYFIGLLPASGQLSLSYNIIICSADIISKIGFGLLVQRVARQRTDEETNVELQEMAVDYGGNTAASR